MAPASNCNLQIPRALVEAVTASRPTCQWHKQGKCRRGARCKFYHPQGRDMQTYHLPRVSHYLTPEGQNRIEIRLPAMSMMKAFFAEKKKPCPVFTCRRVKGTPLIEFMFGQGCMDGPQHYPCSQAHAEGHVDVKVRRECNDGYFYQCKKNN